MSFRKYGGLNYNAKHNNVTSNYNSANKLNVMDFVGQDNSDIIFESDIIAKGGVHVVGNVDISGNLTVDGNADISGNVDISGNLTVDRNVDIRGNLTVVGQSDFNNFVNIDASANIRDLLTVNSIVLTSDQITTNIDGVVPKSYVDAIASGVTPVDPCNCATTPGGSANLNLSSLQNPFIVDDYVVQNGNRVLVKNQDQTGTPSDPNYSTNSVNNGIYVYNSSTNSLTRASDYADGASVGSTSTFIQNGNINSKIVYLEVSAPAIVGRDPLQYAVFYTVQLNLGQGLEYVNGDTLQVKDNLDFVTQVGTLKSLSVHGTISGQTSSSSATDPTLTLYHTTTGNRVDFILNPGGGTYNDLVKSGDILFLGLGGNKDTKNMVIGTWNSNGCGIRLTSSTINIQGSPVSITGNLQVSGQITSASPGTVLLTQVYSYQTPSISFDNNLKIINEYVPKNTSLDVFSNEGYDFIPKNVPYNTYLFIETDCVYWVTGHNQDTSYSRIKVTYGEKTYYLGYGYQFWNDENGGGTRSSTIFPLSSPYNLPANFSDKIIITVEINNTYLGDDLYLKSETSTGGYQNCTIKVTQIVS